MSALRRVPPPVWRLGAAVFLAPAALLPIAAWQLHLVRLLPRWAAGPALAVGAVAALAWLGAGAVCLALARRAHPTARAAPRRTPPRPAPRAHFR
jgi:hypothetical protein